MVRFGRGTGEKNVRNRQETANPAAFVSPAVLHWHHGNGSTLQGDGALSGKAKKGF